jgi:GTP-binding protein
MYVLDAGDGAAAWPGALATVRGELGAFRAELLERPAVVVLNKADLLDAAARQEAGAFLAGLAWPAASLVASAQSGDGLKDLVAALADIMAGAREAQVAADAAAASTAAAISLRPADARLQSFTVERDAGLFVVRGVQIERLFAKADLDNEDAVAYLQQLIERAGLNEALRKAGATPGDTVVVGAQEFEFS